MALTREDDKPWKTDLARKSAQRRELVVHEVEEVIKKAASFEDALKLAAELLKKRFARFSAVSVYVADGEDLALHTSVERPAGPDRLGAGGNPLADAAHGTTVTSISNVSSSVHYLVSKVACAPHEEPVSRCIPASSPATDI